MNAHLRGAAISAAYGAAGIAVTIAAWGTSTLFVHSDALAGPIETLQAARTLITESAFWQGIVDTLMTAIRGLIAATVVGATAGLIIGSSSFARHATRIPIEVLRPIPPLVVLPIAVLVLGPTQAMAEFLVFFGCVLPILVMTSNGVRETDPVTVDTARSFGLSRWAILWRVVLPGTSAAIGTAVRVAMPHAFAIAVIAGFLGGSPGMGRLIAQANVASDSPRLYAIVVSLGVLGLLVYQLSQLIESRVLHWHVSYRKVAV